MLLTRCFICFPLDISLSKLEFSKYWKIYTIKRLVKGKLVMFIEGTNAKGGNSLEIYY